MRPPASETENRTHSVKKIGPSQYSDLFNRIGQESTSRLSSGLKKSRQLSGSFFLPLAQFGAWRIVF
ncbi:MAG: hypothetical protein ACLP19_00745, partial [Xanthobacteraceae bacterium]